MALQHTAKYIMFAHAMGGMGRHSSYSRRASGRRNKAPNRLWYVVRASPESLPFRPLLINMYATHDRQAPSMSRLPQRACGLLSLAWPLLIMKYTPAMDISTPSHLTAEIWFL